MRGLSPFDLAGLARGMGSSSHGGIEVADVTTHHQSQRTAFESAIAGSSPHASEDLTIDGEDTYFRVFVAGVDDWDGGHGEWTMV